MDTQNVTPQTATPSAQPAPAVVPQQPAQQISYGGNKEHGPVGTASVDRVQAAPVEAVPHIPEELRELGIEDSPNPHTPTVPNDARQAGVTPVKTAVPVTTVTSTDPIVPQAQIPTPVNYQQAMQNLREHKADESISWLSMLSKYILEKLGMEKVA